VGIFGKTPSVNEVDADLAAVILAYSDKERTQTLKLLAESQDIIRRTLDSGESPVCAFWHLGGFGGNMLLLITNKRTLSLKKNSIKQELRHEEVAETQIGKFPNGSPLVQIISLKSKLDYRENDNRRFEWIIQFTVDTPRAAQAICAAVDQFLPEK
jgi:hypothetical protein